MATPPPLHCCPTKQFAGTQSTAPAACNGTTGDYALPRFRGAEEPRIVVERLRRLHPDLREFRMERVDQPVRLRRDQRRGEHQDRALTFGDEGVPDHGKRRRSGNLPPVAGQRLWGQYHPRDAIRDVGGHDHQVLRWVTGLDVDKVLDHGQGEGLCQIGHARAWTGPPASKSIRAFTVERLPRVRFPDDPVNPNQLTPPNAIRPRTFSTARAPSSVSISSSGLLPPSARFGLLSHRAAVSSSPIYCLASATMRARRYSRSDS